jgi:hypothetical protein
MKSGLWPRIDVVSPIDDIDDALQPGCRVTETDWIGLVIARSEATKQSSAAPQRWIASLRSQ